MAKEKCPCETDANACCACVSMHCDECHKPNQSKFVKGRFCSNCGRPLKAELTRLYVPKSEVERLHEQIERLQSRNNFLEIEYKNQGNLFWARVNGVKAEVAREIFEDIDGKMLCFFPASSFVKAPNTTHYQLLAMLAELKKKYTEENT